MTTRRGRSATTPGRQSALRFATAVAAVVVINLILFNAVKIDPPQQKVRHRPWPKVYLFPVDEPAATRVQADLLAWMDLLDPTVLSLPSETRGFSMVRRGEFVPPVRDAEGWPVTVGRANLPTIRTTRLTKAEPEVGARALAARLAAPPELPDRARFVRPVFESGVYWALPSGEALPDAPELIVPEALSGAEVLRPTLLSAAESGDGLLRVQVDDSCGDRRLDLLALSAYRRWLGISMENVPEEVQPAKGGVLSVFVQWRFAPGVKLAQPPMSTPLWDGEEWRDLHWR